MKLYRCNVCNKVEPWGPRWASYSSWLLDETQAGLAAITCCTRCQKEATKRLEDGTWVMPVVRQRGYTSKITKPQKGYAGQESQEELLRKYNEQHVEVE